MKQFEFPPFLGDYLILQCETRETRETVTL